MCCLYLICLQFSIFPHCCRWSQRASSNRRYNDRRSVNVSCQFGFDAYSICIGISRSSCLCNEKKTPMEKKSADWKRHLNSFNCVATPKHATNQLNCYWQCIHKIKRVRGRSDRMPFIVLISYPTSIHLFCRNGIDAALFQAPLCFSYYLCQNVRAPLRGISAIEIYRVCGNNFSVWHDSHWE